MVFFSVLGMEWLYLGEMSSRFLVCLMLCLNVVMVVIGLSLLLWLYSGRLWIGILMSLRFGGVSCMRDFDRIWLIEFFVRFLMMYLMWWVMVFCVGKC